MLLDVFPALCLLFPCRNLETMQYVVSEEVMLIIRVLGT